MKYRLVRGVLSPSWVVPRSLSHRDSGVVLKHAPSGTGCVQRPGCVVALVNGPLAERPMVQDMRRMGRYRRGAMKFPLRRGIALAVEELGQDSTRTRARAANGTMWNADHSPAGHRENESVSEHVRERTRTLSMMNEPRINARCKGNKDKRNGESQHGARQVWQQALIRRLETLEAGRDWRGVLAAMDSARNEGVKLSKVVYNKAVSAFAKSGRWREDLTLRDTMRKNGLTPDVYTYSACIDACAKAKQWKKACELLDNMPAAGVKPNGYSYTAAITACGKAIMWQEALALLRQMEDEGIQVTTVTLHAAMDACGIAGEYNTVLQMLEKMRSADSPKHQRPNSRTFNIAIKACAKVAEWRTALDLLAQLRAGITVGNDGERLSADTVSFNATINALGRGGQWKQALALLREMRGVANVDCGPNAISYNSAIDACGRGGQWQQALLLLKEMKELGLLPDEVSFGTTANALGKAGQWSLLLDLLKEMESDGISQNEVVLKAATECCSKADEWKRAVSLTQEMRCSGYLPTVSTLASVIAACGRDGQWEVALSLLAEARHRGPRPTASVYIATAQACGRAGKWEEAMNLMEDMTRDGVRPNEKFFMALLRATGKSGRADKTMDALREMTKRGVTPSVRSYNCAVGACATAGEWQLTVALLSEMLQGGMHPAGFAVASTIRACGIANEWRKGLEVLRQVQQINSFKPDPCSLSVAIEMCCWAGRLDHARSIMPHLQALSGTATSDGWIRDTFTILNASSGESKAVEEAIRYVNGDGVDVDRNDGRELIATAVGKNSAKDDSSERVEFCDVPEIVRFHSCIALKSYRERLMKKLHAILHRVPARTFVCWVDCQIQEKGRGPWAQDKRSLKQIPVDIDEASRGFRQDEPEELSAIRFYRRHTSIAN